MARIPPNELARIKSEVSLLRLIESQGYAVTKQGKDHVISCPFHEEDTPSCIISPKTNLFHCFGCEAAGSVIDWVMKTQGVSFRFACELLQKDISLVAQPHSKVTKDNTTTRLAAPLNEGADEQTALKQVINYYHATLKQSPEALEYLASRGLNHPDLIDTFQLGYANRTLAYRLPDKNRKAGATLRGKLQRIGILRSTGHEHFNGSLVVPVINDGFIAEVYGRKILGKRLRKGTPQHLYLPGAHAGVWNGDVLQASDEVILCEALIDAMTFWVNGFRNVTSSYGANGFTDEHLSLFKQLKIKRVLIAYDRDEGGDTAAEKLASLLNDNGMDAYRVLLPKGMDVNEYAQQVKPAAKSLALVIRQAQWLGQGQAPAISTAAEPVVIVSPVETVESALLETTDPLPSLAASVAVVDAEAALLWLSLQRSRCSLHAMPTTPASACGAASTSPAPPHAHQCACPLEISW